MTELSFTVPGTPVAKGRPKFRKLGKFVQAYTPAKTKKAEKNILACFEEQVKKLPEYDFIHIQCGFYMPIPKGTSKKRTEEWHEKKVHTSC